MTNIVEASVFDVVRRYDTTDPVLGGLTGESNDPIIALTHRTKFLLDRLGFLDVAALSASASIDSTYKYKLIKITAASNLAFPIADIAGFVKGDILTFKVATTAIRTVSINAFAGQSFADGNINFATIYMCDGDTLQLVADTGGWEIFIKPENLYTAGEDAMARIKPRNSVVADGCTSLGALPLRADYARMWAAAVASGSIVDELTWFSDPYRYRAFFSTGNGSTNFRWPDLRGMFFRALDLSRGVDFGRMDNVVNGFEMDAVKDHKHITDPNPNANSNAGAGKMTTGSDGPEGLLPKLLSGGALDMASTIAAPILIGEIETRVKSIGKIPIIYY